MRSVALVRRGEGFLYSARDGLLLLAFRDKLLPVVDLVAVGLSGVRLVLLLLDGLLLGVLLGGDRLGEGEIDIGLFWGGNFCSAFPLWCLLFCWLYLVRLSRLAVSASFLFCLSFFECRLLLCFL